MRFEGEHDVRELVREATALRALLDAADESVVMVDCAGTILTANSVSAARLGLTVDQLVGRKIEDLVSPQVARRRQEQFALAKRTRQPLHFVDQRDGFDFEHAIYPILDDEGEVTRLAIYSRDVSARVKAAEDLRNAEERYRTIIDASPLAIMLVRDGHCIYSNGAAAAGLGYSPAELVGLPVERTIAPEDHARFRERARAVAAGTANPAVEMNLIRRDGSRIVCETTSVPIVLPDGPAALIMGQDITARKQAEDLIRLQAMVLDQIQDRVTVTDLEGRITYANDSQCRSLQRSREDLVGASVEALGQDPVRGATQNEIVMRTLSEGTWRGDVVNFAADGQEAMLDCRTRLVRDLAGRPVAMCGIATDVTEARRTQLELRESEHRFRLLYEQLPAGYQSLDEQGCILEVNQAWQQALGYTREEVLGRSFAEFLVPEQAESFARNFPLFKARGSVQVEFDMVRKDGSTVAMLFVGCIGRDTAGRFLQTHCICTDVTQRREIEQQYRQAQKMEAVGRLAAGVAHDFNNQLTVIRGYCDMLLSIREPGDPAWRALSEIMQASERAQATTSHLLAFGRRQLLAPQSTQLGELLRDLRCPVSTMIGEDIQLVITAAPDLHTVLVDRSAMHQALLNLIVNARDAMPDGGHLVLRVANHALTAEDAAACPELAPGPYVLLEVCDTGQGMDQFTRERLFEPFFTTKPVGKGTGLGLPMVQGFVRQSRGAITVESEPGQGTTFRILLPAELSTAEVEATDGPAHRAARPGGHESVLVVEDDDAVRGMVVRVLAQAGYRVQEAGGPREALALTGAGGETFDLLVTDMVMPEMNGAELATVIQARCPAARVLFISGYLDPEVHRSATDILLKPFSPNDLACRVREALDRVTTA